MPSADNGAARPGPLSTLSGRVRHFEHFQFDVNSLDQALAEIRRLGQSGTLTIKINDGHMRGQAEFKREADDTRK